MNTIPSLLGTTLSGRAFCIPEDLPSTPIALIFEFDYQAHHDVAAWKKFFTVQGIDFLSVPTTPIYIPPEALSDTAKALRTRVSPAARESIVPVHKGGREILSLFGWDPDHFAKVVFMNDGQTRLSHSSGPFNEGAAEAFRAAVQR